MRYLELSDFNQVNALVEEVKRRIDILVNNPEFGCKGYVFQGDTEEYLKMVRLHVVCALKLALAILGQMVGRDEGTVINVGIILWQCLKTRFTLPPRPLYNILACILFAQCGEPCERAGIMPRAYQNGFSAENGAEPPKEVEPWGSALEGAGAGGDGVP